ncbi:MAG: InlB B-repeat-containing protein, partial [Erysipelotrichales bacterium]|nr:InlB B-repeat-containing protein [Erysipelotrichales bacterium]
KDKTIDELKALSKDKIKEDATANVTLTTEDNESDEVEFDEEYKITSSIIEKTTNRTYLITLDANGGEPETQTYQVTQNRQYGVLPTPTREEYIFLGWFLENQKIEGDYLVTESGEHTLIAQWTDNKDFPFDNINYKNFSNAMSSSGADNFQIVSSFDYKIIVVSMINGGGNTYSININGVDKTNEMMARDGHVGALVYKGKKDDVINVTRTSGYGNVNITLIG